MYINIYCLTGRFIKAHTGGTDEHWETEYCRRDSKAFFVLCKLERESNKGRPYTLPP